MKIVSREEWGALPPSAPFKPVKRPQKVIIVHHTVTDQKSWKLPEAMQRLDEWHRNDRKFIAVGYHFVVAPDGTVCEGRPVDVEGAHCVGWNTKAIGIALFGRFDIVPVGEQQIQGLVDLCEHLQKARGVEILLGHRDRAVTKCPGAYAYWELEKIRQKLAMRL